VGINTCCTFYQAGNPQKNQILPHAVHCRFLSHELGAYAEDAAASMSLGAKLEHVSMTPDLESTSLCDNQSSSASDHNSVLVTAQTQKPAPVLSKLKLNFTTTRRKMMQEKVNHCIMKLICINGLVPNILDSDNWAELMNVLNHCYKVMYADDFAQTIITNEAAAHVQKLVLARLHKEHHTAQWVKDKILKVFSSVLLQSLPSQLT
jgi:hypothetical protein